MLIHSLHTPYSITNRRRLGAIILFVCAALMIVGCSGPRAKLVPKAQAMIDNRVMRLQIVAVYNNDRMEFTTEFHVSHLIDADVLDGPPELIGKPIVLPYDMFFVSLPPPLVGEIVVTTPEKWVKRNESGRQRGFGQ
jgi:hypothetical protein